ncbi:MAG: hypothetical protein WC711_01840 [Candidatus Staskawiczbacteria bacterium]|jgi:hypothetical protein
MDKAIIYTVLIIIFAGFLFWGFQSGFFVKIPSVEPVQRPEGILLFFGEDCPHCKNVEAFIQENNIDQKIKLTRLEIPFNGKSSAELIANAGLLSQVATECKIDASSGISIPFLYNPSINSGQAGSCLIGDVDVINFLKNETNIAQQE